MKKYLQSLLMYASVAIITLGVLIPSGYLLGPWFEHKYFPILANQVHSIERHGRWVTWSTVLDKKRNCRITDTSFSLIRNKPVNPERIPLAVTNVITQRPISLVTFPVGTFAMGPLQIYMPQYFVTDQFDYQLRIEGVVVYDCGFPWPSYDIIGPVVVPGMDTPYGIVDDLPKEITNPDLVKKAD